jgi:hypothetical protein
MDTPRRPGGQLGHKNHTEPQVDRDVELAHDFILRFGQRYAESKKFKRNLVDLLRRVRAEGAC